MKIYPKILIIIGLVLVFIIGSVSAVVWTADGPGHYNLTINGIVYEKWVTPGSYTWYRPVGITKVNYLVVGGGGGGGKYSGLSSEGTGGGGGGGVLYGSVTGNEPSLAVTVGAGGYYTSPTSLYYTGEHSIFGSIDAAQGGMGGGREGAAQTAASGGGGIPTAGLGTLLQGNDGGTGTLYGGIGVGGGGGGAGAVGGVASYVLGTNTYWGGNGGLGLSVTMPDTIWYGGGGGGSPFETAGVTYVGRGGTGSGAYGGGGDGQTRLSGINPGNGSVNTGGGGGAVCSPSPYMPGAGGSGIVIIAYPDNSTIAAGSITWDKPYYIHNEVANITYDITGYDAGTYSYLLEVTSVVGVTEIQWTTRSISGATGSEEVTIADTWGYGPYYAKVRITKIADSSKTYLTDIMNLQPGMGFYGYVMDAKTGAKLSGANVKITQGVSTSNVNTLASGKYSISLVGLTATSLTLETTKTGYTTDTHTFTPPAVTGYSHNITLIKNPPTNTSGTTIYGLIRELPYYLPSIGANVTINGSSPPYTTGVTGYYIFNNLAPSTAHTINTTKTGWNSDSTVKSTGTAGTNTSQNIALTTATQVTISLNVKDTDSGVAIDFATITVADSNDGTVYTAPTWVSGGVYNGTYLINKNLIFTVTAVDYYNKYATALTDSNKTVDVLMSKVSQTGGSTQITQTHIVRFLCKDWQGNPVTDMNATVTAVQTTLGSTDWILYLFGYNLDKTPILNTTMTGTTDNSGSVVFVMIQTSKYAIHYEKPTQSIDETRYYYPMDQQYNEIFWSEAPTLSSSKITSSFYNTTNGTYMDLGVRYTDTSATDTKSFTFFIRDENHNLIYTNTNVTPGTSKNISYPVLKGTNGEVYYWGFSAVLASFTNPINRTNYIHFDEARWKLDPMCPSGGGTCGATVDTREFVYNGIAVIMINIFAYIFGRRSIKAGLVVVAAMGLFFYYIGWLQTTVLLMGVAFSLAVIWYIRFAEQESPD